ncbi:hypothetical protein Sru01_01140 [Sphaerisporangium rufum]|uniref:Uncharacterized protein n=1 Tax=Sphaerisporangium rufum TaxID=1381558 RepID=A0A919UYI3_9ACTN|nr:hypothetical protein [Sphaerisporangium rufum]GII75132.1 hypothetical protein Sru01_01140 [Sphaerisporangium rufum]
MYADPPAPQPLQPGETPPAATADPFSPGGQPSAWRFNPEYQKLVDLWQQVRPLLDGLTRSLDKAHQMARSRDVWDAPVAARHVEDITEWRNRLLTYRQAVLTAISDEAADTPRWIPASSAAPHAYS